MFKIKNDKFLFSYFFVMRQKDFEEKRLLLCHFSFFNNWNTLLASSELLTNNKNKDQKKNIQNFFWKIYYQIFMKYKSTKISFYLNCKLMDWVLYNDNPALKGFHGTSEWLLASHNIHVKILHLFLQDVPFLMQGRRPSSPLFSPCIYGNFYMFEIWCFLYLLGIFITHVRSVLQICRN